MGTLSGGHYTCYVKRNKKWYCINDTDVREIKAEYVISMNQSAYILFYRRKKEE